MNSASVLGRWPVALLLLLLPAPGHGQAGPLAWPDVTRESRPWTRWWWLGSAVDTASLTAELQSLAAAGFGGVEVTSIYGVKGQESAFVPYLSDRWTALLVHTASEARRFDMRLDLPPGSGWRMGGPTVPIEDASISLRVSVDTIRGGETWVRETRGKRVDAAVAHSRDGRFADLMGSGPPGGLLRWTAPPGVWTVYVAESANNGEKVKRPAPGGAGNAVDVLSQRAVRRYLEEFGARLGAVGPGTVRAYFHDSYEYTGDGSSELFAAFRQRRGYDLERHLPALLGEGPEDVVARVKSDYRETMDEMLMRHLVVPFTEWAHRRGGLSRNQAHGSPGNILDLYAASDIPETEIFGPLGGTDADPLISKFASSAAHVAGKRLTSAESMTWLGEHFTVTLGQVKQALDQLFVSGVNHVFYHGTAYSPVGAAWPGWLFYASTQFNPRNAFWRDLPALNRYAARVQSVLQSGRPDNDILLYWPVYDNWHNAAGRRMDFRVHEPRWFHDKPLGEVAARLWKAGYGFDYVSDRLLAGQVAFSDGRLASGGSEYRAIVVPRTERIPVETFTRLLDLAQAGATVVFHEQLPQDVPGLADLAARRRRLVEAKGRVTFADQTAAGVRSAAIGRGRVLVGARLDALLEAAGVARERMVDHAGLQYIRRRHDAGRHYFISHSGSQPVDGWVPLSIPAGAVGIMDPIDGQSGLARLRTGPGGRTEVYLQIQPGAALILRSFDRPETADAWRYRRTAGAGTPLRGSWQVDFVSGGPALPKAFRTDTLGSWTGSPDPEAERFAGTARYTIRFDAPGTAENYLLDLGNVAESARVRLNGRDLGTLFARPFRVETGPLRRTGNELEVEVTNLSANRIRDLDRRGVQWKIFHDINFVGIDYKPFDASKWPVRRSGLLGPVLLHPLRDG